MRHSILGILLLLCLRAGAQQYSLTLDPGSRQGPLLMYVQDEQDAAKRLVVLETLEAQEPKDGNYVWISDQLRKIALANGDISRAMSLSQRILQLDPLDAYSAQLLAENCPDEAGKRKWAEEAKRIAGQVVSAKPPDGMQESDWQARVGFARQLLAQGDYQTYTRIRQVADARQRIALAEEFLRQNPKSQYASEVLKIYLNTSREIGDTGRAIVAAEKMLATAPDNPDLLMVLAENSHRRGDRAKVVKYAGRLVELLQSRPDVPRRSDMLAASFWMLGNSYAEQSNHTQADRYFRAALPLAKSNTEMTGAILFHLGWANYKMGNGEEAAKFNQMCLSVPSTLTPQCARNLAVVKSEFHLK